MTQNFVAIIAGVFDLFSQKQFFLNVCSVFQLLSFNSHLSRSSQGWEFPGGPVVKTSPSNAGGAGSIPGWGTKIPHALRPKNQNIKTEAVL